MIFLSKNSTLSDKHHFSASFYNFNRGYKGYFRMWMSSKMPSYLSNTIFFKFLVFSSAGETHIERNLQKSAYHFWTLRSLSQDSRHSRKHNVVQNTRFIKHIATHYLGVSTQPAAINKLVDSLRWGSSY